MTVDCAAITLTGWRGKNLNNCLEDALNMDRFFFEGGITLFDEFDKMFYSDNDYRDAYSPMQDFLKILEGGTYTFRRGNGSETVNLDKTLFLFAGACASRVCFTDRRRLDGKITKPDLKLIKSGFALPFSKNCTCPESRA